MIRSISIPDNWIKLMLHTIAWSIVVIIPLYLNTVFGGGNSHRLYEFYLHTFSAGVVFYVGYLWLVPKFFLRERQVIYFVILMSLIVATHLLTNLVKENLLFNPEDEARFQEAMKKITEKNQNFGPPRLAFGFFNHVISSLLLSGFAIGLGVMEKLKLNEKKQKEMEKEKLHSELAFLKNQVSPHFFFNTLNNIYSLIGIDGPTAQESVLKLSKMMRYLLYESEQGETTMRHEIDFMDNYIDLMKLRLNPRVDLQVNFPKDLHDFTIPPLLFIPFIENAFKHGISHREPSFIKISMLVEQDRIVFSAVNSVGKSSQTGDMQHSGIGLDNVKKRLNLLFPDRYELKIGKTDSVFTVELFIKKELQTSRGEVVQRKGEQS